MKRLKSYKMFEEYINNPTNRIHTLLNNMVKMLQETFNGDNDVLGEEEKQAITLVEIEASLEKDPMEKNIIMNFSDNIYYYQVIFVIKVEDIIGDNPIDKGYMKIKIYDNIDSKLLREWQSDLTIQECTDEELNEEGRFFVKVKDDKSELNFIEQFIITKIGDLKIPLDKKEKIE